MRTVIPWLALPLLAVGQSQIDIGYSPHPCAFNAQGAPTATLPCSALWVDPSMPLGVFRYGYAGAGLDYTRTVANGPALVTLGFTEYRAYPGRAFSFRINDGPITRVDVFQQAGGSRRPLEITVPVMVTDGMIRVALRSISGNVIISDLRVDELAGWPLVAERLACAIPATATADCSGLEYIELRNAAGLKRLWALPAPVGWVPTAQWSKVN